MRWNEVELIIIVGHPIGLKLNSWEEAGRVGGYGVTLTYNTYSMFINFIMINHVNMNG